MNKYSTIVILSIVLVLENISVIYFTSRYQENKRFNDYASENSGVTEACKAISNSDNLSSVLDKLPKYRPFIEKQSDGNVVLHYGIEWSSGAGVNLVFDKDYKLINKNCSV